MADKYALRHPSGGFVVKVASAARRDVLVGRGYVPVEDTEPKPAKSQRRRKPKTEE